MKRLMLAVVALTFSASATAQWVKLGETHDTVLFHALDTFRKEGNLRPIWEIQDFKADVPAMAFDPCAINRNTTA